MEVVRHRPDGQGTAELLVAAVVLRRPELRLAQRPFQGGKQVRRGPGRSSRRACKSRQQQPELSPHPSQRPQPAVGLAQHRGRLEDGEVGGHGLDHFRRQRAVVEAVAETLGFAAQCVVLLAPVGGHLVDVGESAGVPGAIGARRCRRAAAESLPLAELVWPTYQARRRTMVFDSPGAKRQRHEQRGAGRRVRLRSPAGVRSRRPRQCPSRPW